MARVMPSILAKKALLLDSDEVSERDLSAFSQTDEFLTTSIKVACLAGCELPIRSTPPMASSWEAQWNTSIKGSMYVISPI